MGTRQYIVAANRFVTDTWDYRYYYFNNLNKAKAFVTSFVKAQGTFEPKDYSGSCYYSTTEPAHKVNSAVIHTIGSGFTTVEGEVESGTEVMKDEGFKFVRKRP